MQIEFKWVTKVFHSSGDCDQFSSSHDPTLLTSFVFLFQYIWKFLFVVFQYLTSHLLSHLLPHHSKWWWACGCRSCRCCWATLGATSTDASTSCWQRRCTCWRPAAAPLCTWRSKSSTDGVSLPKWFPTQSWPCPGRTTRPQLEWLEEAAPRCPLAWRSWRTRVTPGTVAPRRPLPYCLSRCSVPGNTSWPGWRTTCPPRPRCTLSTQMSSCRGCPSTTCWTSSSSRPV